MRLHILSDLHLSVAPLAVPDVDADVTILAGDISRPAQAIEWAKQLPRPVIYVPGNHEFYGATLAGTLAELRRLVAGTNVHLLERATAVIGGVRFVGTTLWTDFALYDAQGKHNEVIEASQKFVRDFTRIRVGDPAAPWSDLPFFTPDDSAALCRENVAWLSRVFATPHDGPTVVVTHHAPTPKSIHPRFDGSPVNPAFISDLTSVVEQSDAALWIHGHTHDSFDYRVSRTRVLCNPRGYCFEGRIENAGFDSRLCVRV
ncbi:metallophosphoesterase [Pandoraea pulmonicola]|uniref:Phosphoesterase n=1 Tax=Pandoraea pulmonicola TaxID=93221 RepID=A0AAJ5D122_PANPU|nr:metallophosphoesterase [Pandoraea pulmonicola]AJC20384.1 metallophosphoesterase [Pandoraea pulmonicola]SUA91234.1 putative phosphoesterase [Pandoraea pulmonicola]